MKEKILTLAIATALAGSFSGCSSNEKPAAKKNTVETVGSSEAKQEVASNTGDSSAQKEVEMGDYHFQLSPDIQKNGEAHLDFYCHDKSDKHVVGLTGTFHITMPDGRKETLAIEEEKPHDHYHGKLMLSQYGEYRVTAQVIVGGHKLNPRFTFERKKAQ